ncbi:AmpG family muropeptide MFS transporter [Hydrocarboniclastica marina]|nr:MFS transporter [Hydrocarboniclastica marina]
MPSRFFNAGSRTALSQWLREFLHVYSRRPVLLMLLLGFSAGLPLLLVFSTLLARLADVGVETATIGFFAWLGITYSVKVIWAPVIDWLRIPLFSRLMGQRRSWMLLAQAGVAVGLWWMAWIDPTQDLTLLALAGLLVAFSSATQDIAIDAFRIEAASARYQGAMSAAYVFGYRLALLFAGAGALYLASVYSWSWAYVVMSMLMSVGVLAVLIANEPVSDAERKARLARTWGVEAEGSEGTLARLQHWVRKAVIAPFVDFIQRYGRYAVLILLLVAVYRVADLAMGVMANPFYLNFMGFTKVEVANVTKVFGFFMTIIGSAAGGVLVVHYGIRPILLIGAIMTAASNLLFVLVAQLPANLGLLAMVVSADNLSGGIATVALIAWLSSMTNTAFTATQYALFSSLMTLPGKFLGGFSGVVVSLGGYGGFFLISAVMGLPAILLCWWVYRNGDKLDQRVSDAHKQAEQGGAGIDF